MSRSTERAQFHADIIITAVEGGIGYWAQAKDYKWDVPNPADTTVTIRETEDSVEFDGPGKWITITIDDIAAAYGKINKGSIEDAEQAVRIHSSMIKHLRDAYREIEAGDIDALDADAIMQIAALGEVIYG